MMFLSEDILKNDIGAHPPDLYLNQTWKENNQEELPCPLDLYFAHFLLDKSLPK